ncbi:MAG: six-hairpin glycosidase-like protein [Bacteroidota bacterium]
MKDTILLLLLFCLPTTFSIAQSTTSDASSQEGKETLKPRAWKIKDRNSIIRYFDKEKIAYQDNIELAGKRVAGIVTYEVDTSGNLNLERQIFFPQLHPIIKEDDPSWYIYRAYVKDTYNDEILPKLYLNGKQFSPGKLEYILLDGNLNFVHQPSASGIALKRSLYPSTDERLFLERWELKNTTSETINIEVAKSKLERSVMGKDGRYTQLIDSDAPDRMIIASGETYIFHTQIKAKRAAEDLPNVGGIGELRKRKALLEQFSSSLVLETPNATLNTLFEFAKIRASESIFESDLGLIHSPGGGRYYVGIWANDQAEYVSPFFPYLGYEIGNESALNCYRAFAKEINPEYKNIRYAFEVEGQVPPFLLDRGDAAMIAYGASQFVLANGDKAVAEELWPLIEWCLEYCHRQLNEEGVVKSESDEMEGRIETGNANLSTSSLYYGALNLAADLARSLGREKSVIKRYRKQASDLKLAMENYFGATVEGLKTYKYYKEHEYLRHWICLPLVVGIFDRKAATTEALFERLWSENGVHVEKNSDNEAISKIFWDRGTLYALRGTFLAGATEQSLEKLIAYSEERLLGDRVPFPVEAYPEGAMAHLSAESGLYCRIFTEGLFGIVPMGLNSFKCTPRLPKDWEQMKLRNVKAFGQNFDLLVNRVGAQQILIKVLDSPNGKVLMERTLIGGESLEVKF